MKNNIVELPSEYEEMLNKLETQITELFSEIHYYQALLTEKENTIIRLTTENRYLKSKAQNTSSELTPPPSPPPKPETATYPSQESYTPPPRPHQLYPPSTPSQESYTPPPPPPQELKPPSYPRQESYTPPPSPPQQLSSPSYQNRESTIPSVPTQYAEPTITPSEDSRINKRVCPECGAMGFAIKEVDDRTRIISYTPRRIYAKKKSCTKCRHEWH